MQRKPTSKEDRKIVAAGNGAGVVRVNQSLWAISRRDFLKATGLVGAGSLLNVGCDPVIPEIVPDFETTLTRPEDLVYLRFEFSKLARVAALGGGEELVRQGFGTGYIIVHFQSQHIFEEALDETNKPVVSPQPVDARISGASRIVLKVPLGHPPIPFTGQGLLQALGSLEMSVAPNAKPPTQIGGPVVAPGPILVPGPVTPTRDVRAITASRDQLRLQRITAAASDDVLAPIPGDIVPIPQDSEPVIPREPVNGETALEVPYRLILSPNRHGGWAHNTTMDQGYKQGRYELWHTRLGVRSASSGAVNEGPSFNRTVRAIWTRDDLFDPADPETYDDLPLSGYDNVFPGKLKALVPGDRVEIVHQSSNFRDWTPISGAPYTPRPIKVNRLMLSTLGAWLDSSVDFTEDCPLNLVVWDHQSSMGRDYYVKVVRKGRQFPWGPTTLKVTITARRFLSPYEKTAFLWQYTEFRVTDPFRQLPDRRKLPFKSLTCKTLITPKVDTVPAAAVPCEIKVGGEPFLFKYQAVDWNDNPVDISLPATWVPIKGSIVDTGDNADNDAQDALNLFMGYGTAARTIPLNGQRIAFAPSNKKDDTVYETTDITFGGEITSPNVDAAIPFAPKVDETKINVEAIRHLLNQGGPTAFKYHQLYTDEGFDPTDNPAELLLELASGALNADFSKNSDASGGFVDPSLSISGVGRKTGLVSGTAAATEKKFNPTDFLKDAFIFGVVPLADIIPEGAFDAAPKFITKTVDTVTAFLEDALEFKTLLENANAQLTFDTSLLSNQLQAAINAIGDIPAPTAGNFAAKLTDAQAAVSQLMSLAQSLIDDPLPGGLRIADKQDLKRRARSIRDVLGAVNAALKAFATGAELAKNLTVKLEWRTPLKGDSDGFFEPDPAEGGFLLAVEARAKQVGDKPPGADVVAGIENFNVNVFGSGNGKLVTIPFKHLLFKVESGRKPEVDVMFKEGGVGFDGILAFVEMLSKLIPGAGFSDPPALEVDAEGIRASFSVPIPSIAVGVFAMQNMRLSAGFEVPFIGNPLSISFAFCTREEPFVLTIMMIGGGGFVGLKLSPRGMLLLEAALEARAQLAVDFGVASGSISIAAGVYFRLEVQGNEEKGSLTGYLRFQGKVDVLGLISASITLLLELIYEFTSGKLVGRATLTIEVSICFFSFSVEVQAERKLAGSNNDPTFVQQMGPHTLNEGTPEEVIVDPWAEYTGAFILAAA